jgi:hypothetical protein
MSDFFEVKDEDLIDSDDETPPIGWRPSQELLNRMNDAPILDLDAHLGGARESQTGLEWLASRDAERNQKINIPLEEDWTNEPTLKSADFNAHINARPTSVEYPIAFYYIISQAIIITLILVYIILFVK